MRSHGSHRSLRERFMTPAPPAATRLLYWRALLGILRREMLRFLQQRERFVAALVRPLVWLFIFAAGFRAVLGVSITPPYTTYVVYDVYIVPGLIAMIQLFNGMQGSLAMVYDREMGGMRVLLTSPLPRWFLLFARLLAGAGVSLLQVYVFLLVARLYGIDFPILGAVAVLPALILTGLMLGAIGMLLSATIRQLENFAGVMNFVIFPMFFASPALYPLWRIQEASDGLHWICRLNPLTYAVELIRFALYLQFNGKAAMVVAAALLLFFGAAAWAYDPALGLRTRKGGPPGN
jgi:ABC-2 type transport system permease protein